MTQAVPTAPVNVADAGRVAGAVAKAGEGVAQMGVTAFAKLEKAKRFQESKTYEVGAVKGINAAIAEAENDPNNTGDFTALNESLSITKNESLLNVSNKYEKDKLSLDFDLRAEAARVAAGKIYKNNMINKGRSDTLDIIENLQQGYVVTGEESFLNEIESNASQAEKNGFWDAEDARKLAKNNVLKAREMRFLSDAGTGNPNDVNVADYGFDLERRRWAEGQLVWEKNRYAHEEDVRYQTLYRTGKLTNFDVQEAVDNRVWQADRALKFSALINDPIAEYKRGTDSLLHNELLADVLNPEMPQDETFQKVVDAYVDGKLARKEFNKILSKIPTSYIEASNTGKDQTSLDRGLATSHKFYMRSPFSSNEKAQMITQLMDAAKNPNMSEDAVFDLANNIYKNRLKAAHPQLMGLDDMANGIATEKHIDQFWGDYNSKLKADRVLVDESYVIMTSPEGIVGKMPKHNVEAAREAGFK